MKRASKIQPHSNARLFSDSHAPAPPSGVYLANIDGASRGNPGPAAYAVVLRDPAGKIVLELAKKLGRETNNVAEYYALLAALDAAASRGIKALRIRSDSELLVRQIEGRYKVKNEFLKPLHERASKLRRQFAYFAIEHVPREKNSEADALANLALDGNPTNSTPTIGDERRNSKIETRSANPENRSAPTAVQGHKTRTMSIGAEPRIIPTVLEGRFVRLEPLRSEHEALLWEAAKDSLEDIFRWMPLSMQDARDFHAFMERAAFEEREGQSVVFATLERTSGKVVGSTRFMNIDRANRRVEIGWTWIAPAWQRTAINTEAKYMMLRHAFEQWKCVRVELKTDALNERSRAAILRIGAKEEGVLRQHMVCWDGRLRDSVYFSVLDKEWPEVRSKLESRLSRQ